VQQHAGSFIAHTEASTGAELPRFITDEFDPWRDGTTHVVMSPLELMQRLAAPVLPPFRPTPRRSRDASRERLLRGGEFRTAKVAEGSPR